MGGRGAELTVGLKEIAVIFNVQVQQTPNGYAVGKYDGEPASLAGRVPRQEARWEIRSSPLRSWAADK